MSDLRQVLAVSHCEVPGPREILDHAGYLLLGGKPHLGVEACVAGSATARALLDDQAWASWCEAARSHPTAQVLRQDPLTDRSRAKPRGYPGDAVLLDLIYGLGPSESTLTDCTELGKAIYDFTSNSASGKAVCERRHVLAEFVDRMSGERESVRVLAVASGHLREAELSRALAHGKVARWIALDQDALSVQAAVERLGPPVEPAPVSIGALLKCEYSPGQVDAAYAAGLYDYLPEQVAMKLTRCITELLAPGGSFLFANFTDDHLEAAYLDCFMEWSLILRSEAEMERIARSATGPVAIHHWRGENGAVRYCEVKRLPE